MTPQFYDPAVTDPDTYQHGLAAAAALTAAAAAQEIPEAEAPSANSSAIDWDETICKVIRDGHAFLARDVPERAALLGAFLRAGDLGFIYAPRGVGKTWLALLMAGALGRGTALGEWTAGTAGALRVCYVDGEVNLPDAMERAALLQIPDNVHWLHHEDIAEATGHGLNLADPLQQDGLMQSLLARNIQVLFLDNLSCLFRGVAENEADAWEHVLSWLLNLRRHHITVILVAHAGRNGEMRGTSRREDAAHWVLKLEDAGDSESTGAEFKSSFTKNRNARQAASSCPPLRWKLETVDEQMTVACARCGDVENLVDLVNNGLTRAAEIAEELRVAKSTVSKWARKAADRGLIRIENRDYLPV